METPSCPSLAWLSSVFPLHAAAMLDRLPEDLWHELSRYMDEPCFISLRKTGCKTILKAVRSLRVFSLTWPLPKYSTWPISPERSSQLFELTLRLDREASDVTVDFSSAILPKTLRRATFEFRGAHLPFSVPITDPHDDNIAKLDQELPNLRHLKVLEVGWTENRRWSIPSALQSFDCCGLSAPHHYPSNLETLIMSSQTQIDPKGLANLPKTLTTLQLRVYLHLLPQLPLLRSLRCGFSRDRMNQIREVVEFPPSLTEFCDLNNYEASPTQIVWPRALTRLKWNLNIAPELPLPQTLTKWYAPSMFSNRLCGRVPCKMDILSALPPLLQTLSLSRASLTAKGIIASLPRHLTSLSFEGVRVDINEYRHLPLTLTTLYAPTLNERTIVHIARLVNLRELAALGGLLSAAVVRKLPRGISSLQLHGVALDTKTQRRWKKMNISPETAFRVFDGTLPPHLTELIVFHHYDHPYYWHHTYELYKNLPTSLKELHLMFWRPCKTRARAELPSSIRLCADLSLGADAENPFFSRLVNLEALTFDYPATASSEHSIPLLPSSGRLKDLYFGCAKKIGPNDRLSLPTSLKTFNSNQEGDFYYTNLLNSFFTFKGLIKFWGIVRGDWREFSV